MEPRPIKDGSQPPQPITDVALQLQRNKGTFIIQLGICHESTKGGKFQAKTWFGKAGTGTKSTYS